MNKNPDISIIIINYKNPVYCVNCIRSLQEKTKNLSYEVLVVDNDSNDGIESIIKKEFGDSVLFHEAGSNLGTVRGYNLGKTLLHGKYLFLLNSDTLFINNALYEMKTFLDDNPKTAMVGANLYHKDMTEAHSFRKEYSIKTIKKECRLLSLLAFAFCRNKRNPNFNNSQKPLEVMYVSAAAALIRREALDQVGWFAEDRFMYGEEPDIGESFRKIGYNVVNVPTAKIIHFEGGSGTDKKFSFSKASFLFSLQGNGAFFLKWGGKDGQNIYYESLKKELKNKEIIAGIAFHKNLFCKYRLMRNVLSDYLKNKKEIDSQILTIR